MFRSPRPLRQYEMPLQTTRYKESPIKSLAKRQQVVLRKFFHRMKELIAINYRTGCNFQQEWQKESESSKNDEHPSKYMLKQTDNIYMVYIIVTLLAHIAIVWFMSVKEIYSIGGEQSTVNPVVVSVAIAWMVIQVLDMIVELNTVKMLGQRQVLSRKETFSIYLEEDMASGFLNIIIADSLIVFSVNTVPSVLLTVISIWTLLRKIMKKKQAFKTFSNDVELLGHFNLAQLLTFALMMGHIFSLFLYSSAFIGSYPQNWLKKYQIATAPWYVQYIYALYWAITTMTTVGYGDITASNPIEICFSIFVEILGCAIFGYMINIIGMILTDMRKAKETLDEEILITKKLSKCFNLSRNLTFQVINYIENNHKTEQSFTVEEEGKLFGRLNTRLKNEVLLETNQRVLKKCVLFLTQFTRNLQNQIALKLIKKVFQPNQIISDQKNNSIYLLDRGTVEIMLQRRHHNKSIQKTIKDLRDSGNKGGLNVYGVVGFFTDDQRNIVGVSRTFTVAYQLKKKDFMEVLQDNPFDSEKYFEIRDRINLMPMPEQIEGPMLADSKYHYCPNKYLIVKKYTHSPKMGRQRHKRDNKRTNAYLTYIPFESRGNISLDQVLFDQSKQSAGEFAQVARFNTDRMLDMYRSEKMISLKNIKKEVMFRAQYEVIKNYDNYFPLNNFRSVILKYNQKRKARTQ